MFNEKKISSNEKNIYRTIGNGGSSSCKDSLAKWLTNPWI